MQDNFCPVCGYKLSFLPWSGKSSSDDICPSCGTQFGYHDAIRFKGSDEQIKARYDELRRMWISGGMKWHFPNNKIDHEPKDWNPKRQLLNIGIEL